MDFILDTLGKVGFEWKMGLFNLVNFLVIFMILKRYAFKPITARIDDRTKLIREGVENAEQARSELLMSQRKAQEIVDESKVEANRIIEQAKIDAGALAENMKSKAKREIEALVAQARRNIEIDREEMRDTLRSETVELVTMAASKIIGKVLDTKKDKVLVEEALNSLE